MLSAIPTSRKLLIALIALLIAGSLLPDRAKHCIGTQGVLHRPLHVLLFAATAATALAAVPNRIFGNVLALSALALALELAEHLLYRNPFEWRDVRDDALGILLGLFFAYAAITARNRFVLRKPAVRP